MGDMANPALINALSKGYDPAARESQLLGLQTQRNALADYPGEKAWTEEERGMKRTEGDLMNKARTFDLWNKLLDVSTLENHDQIRASLKDPDFIPPASSFGGDKKKFEEWKAGVKGWMKNEFQDVEWKQDAQGNYVPLPKKMRTGETAPTVSGRETAQSDYGKFAQDIYGKSYRQLNPEERADVDKRAREGKEVLEKAPAELRQFEMETGISEKLRGTKEYQEAINKWRQSKKEAIHITSPFEHGKYAASLRKEFEDLKPVKDYRDLVSKFGVMKEAYDESLTTKNFVATDQAIITLFNKMTDPQSVVRESEYARTPSDLALMNRLKGKIEKLVQGGPGLTQEDRKALLTMGNKFFDTYTDIYKNEVQRFRGYAGMAGLDPDYVVEKYKSPAKKSEKKPPGEGEKGGTVQFREGSNTWDIPADQVDEFTRSHPKAKKEQRVSQLKAPPEKREGPDYSTLSDDDLINMVQGAPSNAWLQKEAEKRWGKEWKKKIFGQGENLESAIG